MLLGLGTVAMLLFFGMAFRESSPTLGFIVIGFAGLRAVLWCMELAQLLMPGQDEEALEEEFFEK
ncbi:MAG: hypothetical protein GY898_21120 [Proteobacteria bacterium]|nr:hypothetical protein [Pseudomonadota bacterium]